MGSELELHQVIYAYLLTQIQFGFYRCGESLPGMEELSRQSHISLDTVTLAYHRLCREGYISLTQKAGAKVAVSYRREEIGGYVRRYFAQREAALRDLSRSIWPLFGWALWLSLKHAPPEAAEQELDPETCGAISDELREQCYAQAEQYYTETTSHTPSRA